MPTVPSGTRFIGIATSVDLTERKSALLNKQTEPFSIEDIASTVGVGAQGPQGVQGPAGPLGPVGPAGLEWQGAWVSGTSYIADDAVGYNGASWFCILATSGTTNPSADATHWALLASQGAQGIQGVQGPTGPQGASGGAGTLQQTVDNGNTITDGTTTMSFYPDGIITNDSLGGKIALNSAAGEIPYLGFGIPASGGKIVKLYPVDTITANRLIRLPDASGTIALRNYKSYVSYIQFSSDGSVDETGLFNDLDLDIYFQLESTGVYIMSSALSLLTNKTVINPFDMSGSAVSVRLPIFNDLTGLISGYYSFNRLNNSTIKLYFWNTSNDFINPYTLLNTKKILADIRVYA